MNNVETVSDGRQTAMKSMTASSFGDGKMSKDKELNKNMSVAPQEFDELTNKLRGGVLNG